MHMTELDYKMLHKRKKNRSGNEEANDSSDENEDLEDENIGMQETARKRMDMKDKVQFKRKKAKVIIYTQFLTVCFDCFKPCFLLLNIPVILTCLYISNLI